MPRGAWTCPGAEQRPPFLSFPADPPWRATHCRGRQTQTRRCRVGCARPPLDSRFRGNGRLCSRCSQPLGPPVLGDEEEGESEGHPQAPGSVPLHRQSVLMARSGCDEPRDHQRQVLDVPLINELVLTVDATVGANGSQAEELGSPLQGDDGAEVP